MTSFKVLMRHILYVFSVFFFSAGFVSAATLESQVSSSSDDAEEYTNGTVKFTSSDLELVDSDESSAQTIGMRFNNLELPAGAIISAAYIQFQVDESSSGASTLTIYGEANDNPVTYDSTSNNITSRPQTTANVNWNPVDWSTVGSNGTDQQTNDLSVIIQELVNRTGWNSGQSMAFMITGSGTRTAESFNGGDSSGAPILHIEYNTDGNPAPVASFTATPTTGNAPLNVSFDGTASTDDSAIASYDWAFGDGTSATGATANHTYTPGTYTATLTVTDDAGKTNSTSQTITVIDPNAPIALDIPVNSSSDDAEEYTSGSVKLGSSDLELVDSPESSAQVVGIRFSGIALPSDAVISKAYIQFQVDETSSNSTALTIYGEANDSPVTYSSTSNNITTRPKTAANISWNPANWTTVGSNGIQQQTSDLSSIVRELVNRGGWNSGQSMAFMISGTGKRTAESYDGSSSGAPSLHIEYTTDGNPAPIASFSATPNSGNAPLDVDFDGSGSSDDSAIASYNWSFGDGTSATGATANHTYTPGTYTATLTVTDDAGKTNSSSQTITVIDPNAPTVLNIQVSSSSDDAEEYTNGTVNTDSSDLELTQDSSSQTIGMRFNGIALPTDAVISSAYLQFQVDESSTTATQLTVYGEANANPVTFSTTSNDITDRALTNANSAWTPDAWPNTSERGAAQRSTDISAIVQELVSQSGWNSDQSMVFIINGTGKRTAESYDGSTTGAPILHIEYTTDGNPAPIANFTATPTSGNAPLEVNFDGTGSTDDSAIVSYDWDFGDDSSATGATASHTYASGTYTATLTVTDDAGKSSSTSQNITVIDPNAPTTLDIQVSSPSDDAEQRSDASMYLDSSDLELVNDGGTQQVGIRFNGLNVPPGSTITGAYIQFQSDEISSEATTLNIRGEANDNPPTFTSTDSNISDRPLSNASVSWSPVAWDTANVKDADQQTTDLSSIVQELINRAGWNSGQSMVFILTGNGQRIAESYEGSVSGAPTLHIEYTNDGNPPPVAAFIATPTSGDVPLNVGFDGSGSSDDTGIVDYAWDFGDGTTESTSTSSTSHTYTTAGTYTVSVTVTDDGGKTSTSTQTDVVTVNPVEISIGKLNDTGITTCGDYAFDASMPNHNNDLDCVLANGTDGDGDPVPDGQDGQTVVVSSFTKISATGEDLSESASDWSCVRDNVTGYIWEVKTTSGLHSKDDRYMWYNPDATPYPGYEKPSDVVLNTNPLLINNPNTPQWEYAEGNIAAFDFTGQDDSLCADAKGSAFPVDNCNMLDFANKVNQEQLCGLTGWRVPARDELRSIVDIGDMKSSAYPVTNTTYFPNTQSSKKLGMDGQPRGRGIGYAVKDTATQTPFKAWGLYFGDSQIDHEIAKEELRYVRLVKGEVDNSNPRFEVSSDRLTVTDTKTKLIWKRCTEGQVLTEADDCQVDESQSTFTWLEAFDQTSQTYAGHSDWRIPTLNELTSIPDLNEQYPAIDDAIFPSTPFNNPENYWTSSAHTGFNEAIVWAVSFGNGGDRIRDKNSVSRIRLVRDATVE